MAQRDDPSFSSRRIFLAWMMALPMAGRAAAQLVETVPNPKAWADEYDPQSPAYRRNQVQKTWADEYDPTSPASKGKVRAWADEYDPQSPAYKGKSELREARWRDEIDRPPTKQKAWADEYDPTSPAYKGHERVWADEIQNPQKLERCWLDEIQNPRIAARERAWRDEIDRPPIAKRQSRRLQERCWLDEISGPQPRNRDERG